MYEMLIILFYIPSSSREKSGNETGGSGSGSGFGLSGESAAEHVPTFSSTSLGSSSAITVDMKNSSGDDGKLVMSFYVFIYFLNSQSSVSSVRLLQ